MNNFKNSKTKLFIVFLLFILIFLFLVVIFYRSKNTIQPSPKPEPVITFNATPFIKTVPGTTTQEEVERLENRKSVVTNPDGSIQYNFPSALKKEDNTIIVKNNKVIFEKEISYNPDYTLPKLSDFKNKLGEPEKIIIGSKKYGESGAYYIYASKGVTLIVDDLSKPIYYLHEVQSYIPGTVDEYIRNWGSDISLSQTEGP